MIRPTRALGALGAVLLLLATGSPAHADPDRLRLGLSASGPFAEQLAGPLFTGSYVPGSDTSTFYVQNTSPSTTRATISWVPAQDPNEFEEALSFTASAGGQSSGTPVPYYVDKKKNQCRTLVTGPTIDGGGVQRIDVTMVIDEEYEQPDATQTADFGFVVTLSQVTKKGKVDVCGPQSPGGATTVQVLGAQAAATTGNATGSLQPSAAPRSAGLVYSLAVGAMTAGALLWLVARRRRRTEPVDDARG